MLHGVAPVQGGKHDKGSMDTADYSADASEAPAPAKEAAGAAPAAEEEAAAAEEAASQPAGVCSLLHSATALENLSLRKRMPTSFA